MMHRRLRYACPPQLLFQLPHLIDCTCMGHRHTAAPRSLYVLHSCSSSCRTCICTEASLPSHSDIFLAWWSCSVCSVVAILCSNSFI